MKISFSLKIQTLFDDLSSKIVILFNFLYRSRQSINRPANEGSKAVEFSVELARAGPFVHFDRWQVASFVHFLARDRSIDRGN
jgi:hypothetical protein